MEKNVLLASFVKRENLYKMLNILKSRDILNNKVFILRDVSNKNKLILTYNIFLNESHKFNFEGVLKGTISLHRKKETNTLYTLNALNELVKEENNNRLDKDFTINWDKYRNCLLIMSKDKGLVKIKTILESIKNL